MPDLFGIDLWVDYVIAKTDRAMQRANGKLDAQSLSYTDATPNAILNQLNQLGTTHRRERDRMQRELMNLNMNLKLRNSVVTALVTAALVKAPDIIHWAAQLFR